MRWIVLLLLLWAAPASAQITLPYTSFSTPTILRAEVEANDAQLANLALNRTGGTMTGSLAGTALTLSSTLTVSGAATLNSTLAVTGATTLAATSVGNLSLTGTVLPSVTNVRDLGSSSFRFDEAFLRTLDVSLNSALGGTLTVTGTQTFVGNTDLRGTLADSTGNLTLGDAVDVSGLITGSAGITITGTATATTFSGSGASLTSIPETAITDGSALARIAANEAITGNWTFGGVTSTNTSVAIDADSTVNGLRWGHSNSAYLNTLGATSGGGTPFICFWCYHGPNANTLRRSSGAIPPTVVQVTTGGNIEFATGTVSSADTDFTQSVLWTIEADGDLIPGTNGNNLGTSALKADVYARSVVLDDGTNSAPALQFNEDGDGIYSSGDALYIGMDVDASATNASAIFTQGATPSIQLVVGDGSVNQRAALQVGYTGGVLINDTHLRVDEVTSTPSNPTNGAEANIYVKGDLLIIQFNDAGTVRYKYLDLTGTGVTWVHTTSAP